MDITLNGKNVTITDALLISDLLKKYNIKSDIIVIELNRVIIQKDNYSSIALKHGDQIEIVQIVGGG